MERGEGEGETDVKRERERETAEVVREKDVHWEIGRDMVSGREGDRYGHNVGKNERQIER